MKTYHVTILFDHFHEFGEKTAAWFGRSRRWLGASHAANRQRITQSGGSCYRQRIAALKISGNHHRPRQWVSVSRSLVGHGYLRVGVAVDCRRGEIDA
jgi:hypothetical protein